MDQLMKLNPKKHFSKKQAKPHIEVKEIITESVVSPSTNQNKIEAQNLEKPKKS